MAGYMLRRAAVQAVASSQKLARHQSTISRACSLSRPFLSASSTSVLSSVLAISFRRSYATEDQTRAEQGRNEDASDARSQVQSTINSAARTASRTASETNSQAQSAIGSVAQAVQEKAVQAKNAVASAVNSGFESVTPDNRSRGRGDGRMGSRLDSREEASPSNQLYVGNLYFEVTEAALKQEFANFGPVSIVNIIYDARGLSKGFGYVTFESQADANAARQELDGKALEGRRLTVQWAAKKVSNRFRSIGSSTPVNPPSKTLFIGNMSYEMSDKDLNDLFRGIKNVLDVRVAIDRRTGQPRGFAHADFIDVPSAEAAAEFLSKKEFYGRMLKIDYSANAPSNAGSRGETSDRS